MNADLESVLIRLETVERQARAWKLLVAAAIVLAAAAIAAPLLISRPMSLGAPATGKFAVVEARRFLLRDTDGTLAGGMEIGGDGGLKLVLGRGYGTMGAAFLEVQGDGNAHLTLRGPDGGVRASLLATKRPVLVLSPEGQPAGASLRVNEDGSGLLLLTDRSGRVRFRAP
jgi:hypothetical protein